MWKKSSPLFPSSSTVGKLSGPMAIQPRPRIRPPFSTFHPPSSLLRCFPKFDESAPRIRPEVQVMFFDTDCAAVVHNIAYLRFIEVARTHLAEELGLGLAAMAETKKHP